ncbi:hypothetical protein [Flavobacterium cerinum]|uniref:Polysaccharide deacetylase n=1 Tax=Flavobacterium cerinum TaxID=2502784 RepID=A0ABY5IQ97_9FLAO|nr:hypothetical protein [Flavobacterium cerinum]UUC44834.1 hypothetical protein NOX80_14505 [Flavobacterium cerinum]
MTIRLLLFSLFSITVQAQSENDYYRFSADLYHNLNKDTTAWRYQMSATQFSISGYYKTGLEIWDKNGVRKPNPMSSQDSLLFFKSKQLKAKDYIVDRSKNEQIIIINEAHTNARHRTFTRSLLKGLYDNGYRYLGLEALQDTIINRRKFPVLDSGVYTKEPEFGNLLSEALQIGFTVFGYEASEGKNRKEREIEQARNIQAFIDSHPKGKVLIHCGHDHVFENEHKTWEKAMAGRIKEYTGIDPFTINQIPYTEKGSPEFNPPYINQITENDPVVLRTESGTLFNGLSAPKQTDIIVLFPPTRYEKGRPNWLQTGKVSYILPKKKIKNSPLLIAAYRTKEYEQQGIPADIIEITEKNVIPPLYLAPGTYDIIIKDKTYKIQDRYSVTLK